MIGGVRLSGDAGRILVGGKQVGNLYGWTFDGKDGRWKLTAAKYRLAEEVSGDVEFCFLLPGHTTLEATGQFFTDCIADNEVHREPVEVRGQHCRVTNQGR